MLKNVKRNVKVIVINKNYRTFKLGEKNVSNQICFFA